MTQPPKDKPTKSALAIDLRGILIMSSILIGLMVLRTCQWQEEQESEASQPQRVERQNPSQESTKTTVPEQSTSQSPPITENNNK